MFSAPLHRLHICSQAQTNRMPGDAQKTVCHYLPPSYLYFLVLLFYTLAMSISEDFVLQMLIQALVLGRPKELSRGEVILHSASAAHSPGTGLSWVHFASHHNQIILHGCPAFPVISPLQIVMPSHSVSKEITLHFRPLIGAQSAFGPIPILSNPHSPPPGEKKK